MAAAAIALSSCSSEETTDVAKSSAITFRPTVGLNSRGAETKIDNLTQMWVSAFYNKEGKDEYGQPYFENKLFPRVQEELMDLLIQLARWYGRKIDHISL